MAYQWPGNVRELRNTIRRACILATEPVITPDLFPFVPSKPIPQFVVSSNTKPSEDEDNSASAIPLWVVERDHILNVLKIVDQNKSKAAKILEIDRKTLYTKLERYGLET
jgi:two-component system NtrC family response regulator